MKMLVLGALMLAASPAFAEDFNAEMVICNAHKINPIATRMLHDNGTGMMLPKYEAAFGSTCLAIEQRQALAASAAVVDESTATDLAKLQSLANTPGK